MKYHNEKLYYTLAIYLVRIKPFKLIMITTYTHTKKIKHRQDIKKQTFSGRNPAFTHKKATETFGLTVRENFVGLGHLFKLLFCLLLIVWVFVWVPFQRQFPVTEQKQRLNRGGTDHERNFRSKPDIVHIIIHDDLIGFP